MATTTLFSPPPPPLPITILLLLPSPPSQTPAPQAPQSPPSRRRGTPLLHRSPLPRRRTEVPPPPLLRDRSQRRQLRGLRREREQEGRRRVHLPRPGHLEGAPRLQGREGHQRHRLRVLQPQEGREGVPHLPLRLPRPRAAGRGTQQPRALGRPAAGPHRQRRGRGRGQLGRGQGREGAALLPLRDRRRGGAQPHQGYVRQEQALRPLRQRAQRRLGEGRGDAQDAARFVQDRRRRPGRRRGCCCCFFFLVSLCLVYI
ncbi:putative thylakoid lumenal 19 kDa protein, chloroplastic [Iris pallida]|uniref:Thylakoid lumenal 19 kDa protein, chloroplastic n=1 Tax=Iris pallida TaxID=29817 RepID=A0AAX6FQK5_IRIPA|nr:putative thylakoid lumenal 19 kDa protein, chloroplastic [Iris pallida]